MQSMNHDPPTHSPSQLNAFLSLFRDHAEEAVNAVVSMRGLPWCAWLLRDCVDHLQVEREAFFHGTLRRARWWEGEALLALVKAQGAHVEALVMRECPEFGEVV